jgi:hypothetical protein
MTTALVDATSKEISKTLNKNKNNILLHIKNIIRNNLMNSPEVKSLSDPDGKLRVELGVVDGAGDIAKIIDDIVSKITMSISNIGTPSKGIDISIMIFIDEEYTNLYSKTYSSYTTKSGTKIEWLNWLLEAGNSDVVFGYKIKYGVEIGRTGDAVMMPSQSANWSVPPEFSGVADNNFITRSFEGVDEALSNFIGGLLS